MWRLLLQRFLAVFMKSGSVQINETAGVTSTQFLCLTKSEWHLFGESFFSLFYYLDISSRSAESGSPFKEDLV